VDSLGGQRQEVTQRLSEVSPAGDGTPAIRASILLVDDKPQNLLVLAQMLEVLDENIIQVRSGADALRYLLRQDFAIILVDVQMPDMDGYELASLIRQRDRSRHLPIIFITAYSRDDADISRGYALGAVDYVFKPIDPVILRAKVSVFVDLYKKTEAIRQKAVVEQRLLTENLLVRSEKIEAERALRQIEERQALIIRSLPIALYTADLGARFAGPRFLSESIAGAVGFESAAFIGDPELWTDRIHPSDLQRVVSEVAAAVDSGRLTTEYRWRCADGTERVFLDQGVVLRDEAGSPREILGTCLDVTDRRRLEQQLLQSQKMEAVGQLTGGIAHDFNNMLSVVIWNLDRVAQSLPEGKLQEQARLAMSGALNCAELTRQLLTFARHQPDQPKGIDLLEVSPRLSKLLGPVIGSHIEIDIRMADDVWPIYADPARVESALLNLVINARDAMPDGGTIVIEGFNVPRGGFDLDPSNDYVALSVIDTGTGMSQEIIDRAFEPFFTTKAPGEGTGLGLSMVYAFAKQARGHVKIESQAGMGTAVRLYLPRSEDLPASDCADIEIAALDRTGKILVVEDDTDVRGMTVARLEEFGYRVCEADCGAAALKALRSDTSVDLLFTDVVMPGGMSGLDLARRALELQPAIKVVFTSGYASSFHGTGEVMGELLQKPYSDSDLKEALRRALEGNRPGARRARRTMSEGVAR
jgi:PAS domain S-box-containing protein